MRLDCINFWRNPSLMVAQKCINEGFNKKLLSFCIVSTEQFTDSTYQGKTCEKLSYLHNYMYIYTSYLYENILTGLNLKVDFSGSRLLQVISFIFRLETHEKDNLLSKALSCILPYSTQLFPLVSYQRSTP